MKWKLVLVLLLAAAGAVVTYRFWPAPTPQPDGPAGEDLVAAEQQAREAVHTRPSDPQAYLQLARALRRRGRFEEAGFALRRAGELGLPAPDGRREAALLLAGQDWPPRAEGILQQAVKDHPDDPELLEAVSRAFAARGKWAAAEPLLTRLLARDPGNRDLQFRRGEVRMRLADFAGAVTDLRPVVEHDPGHFEARLYLANSLLGDARIAEARAELQTCRKLRPDRVEPLVGLARCELERDEAAAARLLDEAAALAPDNPLVLQEVAAIYLRSQRIDAAIAALVRLVGLDPENKQAHLNLAQAYLAAGRPDEARRHEARYQELDRRDETDAAARRGMRAP
ncbi:tetratricopeptide repeat protein [bacterium]|nr:tetratricopeptide repeat protein [bacterium]